MSNDVVIGKSKRDEVITDLIALKAHLDPVVYETWRSNLDRQIEYLRDLPETVSLEGVETRFVWVPDEVWGKERGKWEDGWGKLSALRRVVADLRGDELRLAFMHGAKWWEFHSTKGTMWQSDQHLVAEAAERRYHGSITSIPAPVQPSAVVSRETIEHALIQFQRQTGAHTMGDQEMQSTFGFPVADFYQRIVQALQLPQPVAPVQSGGVDLSSVIALLQKAKAMSDQWSMLSDGRGLIGRYIDDSLTMLHNLTTTQSAPSADSAGSGLRKGPA